MKVRQSFIRESLIIPAVKLNNENFDYNQFFDNEP